MGVGRLMTGSVRGGGQEVVGCTWPVMRDFLL